MQSSHSAVTSGDLELLDVLCIMPSSFPHQASSVPSKPKPLSTLNALRRPPIDPMVLAASLSSGPHVTRHHFHHSFGAGEHSKDSAQMPASQRKLQQQQQQEKPCPRKLSTSGSYANCDYEDFENEPSTSAVKIQPVPEVTDEERAMYASRQAPRSVRIQQEKSEREMLKSRSHQASATTSPTAQQRQLVHASDIRASDEPARPSLESHPGNMARETIPVQGKPADAIAKALDERKSTVVASVTPSLGTLPAPGLISAAPSIPTTPLTRPGISSIVRPPPLMVRCYARTRIPTPHGEIFCHLYKNNHDAKEHLALVVDPQQNDGESVVLSADGRPVKEKTQTYQQNALRSKTLDEVWGPSETEMERIVRGAYVGRLGPSFQVPSQPVTREASAPAEDQAAPLVRIHSECYTGETIGSQRCDCGEQLDEAIRLICEGEQGQPALTRGVVVYLRQEGRGIGLLDKLMAYNLQDMGHDTVSANILLGHLPDARKYDIASAILRDLGVGECRLLTNNPEKMEALESEGVKVTERVGMVPRAWKFGKRKPKKAKSKKKLPFKQRVLAMDANMISQAASESDTDADPTTLGLRHQGEDLDGYYDSDSDDDYVAHVLRKSGATMIGGSITQGPELEKYLRTKVERMGHLLDLPAEEQEVHSQPNTDDEKSQG